MSLGVRFLPGPASDLYIPVVEAPAPAILVLHGSEGAWSGWAHWQALAFAVQGFAAYVHPYAHGGNLWHAGDIRDVDLDRTEEALRWLRAHETVTGKVGLYGGSRGAEHAILLASLMAGEDPASPDLPDAVAAHSPSDTIAGAFVAGTCSPRERETWDPSLRAWRWRGSSEALTPTTPIALERYAGPVFLSHGERDDVWSVACTRRLEARLRAAGRTPEVYYEAGQGHSFSAAARAPAQERVAAFFRRHLT